jgi:hypothetical protein
MKKFLIFLMLIPLLAVAADRDMDGVRDDRDQCKNTPFWAVVNSQGCTVKRIRHRKK